MRNQKENIIEQGFKIIFKDGLRGFTVDRLSSLLHVSKKTIYSIFATKEILIDKIIQYKLLSIDREIDRILNKNECPIRSFYEINQLQIKISSEVDINKISELKTKYPDIWIHIENHRKDQRKMLENIFLMADKMNYIREELNPKEIARLFMNIINRTFQPEFFIQEENSLKETVLLYIEIMSNGIFNKNALLKLKKIREDHEI